MHQLNARVLSWQSQAQIQPPKSSSMRLFVMSSAVQVVNENRHEFGENSSRQVKASCLKIQVNKINYDRRRAICFWKVIKHFSRASAASSLVHIDKLMNVSMYSALSLEEIIRTQRRRNHSSRLNSSLLSFRASKSESDVKTKKFLSKTLIVSLESVSRQTLKRSVLLSVVALVECLFLFLNAIK